MMMWATLRQRGCAKGRINVEAAPLAFRLNGDLVLSLIDVPRPIPLPPAPDARELAAFAKIRSQIDS